MERILTLRKRIDEIDQRILHSLKKRVEVCRNIGTVKREHGIPVRDSKRENEVGKHVMTRACEEGLDQHDVKAVYQRIIAMCIHAQEANVAENNKSSSRG